MRRNLSKMKPNVPSMIDREGDFEVDDDPVNTASLRDGRRTRSIVFTHTEGRMETHVNNDCNEL
jgi:hypothetical protein